MIVNDSKYEYSYPLSKGKGNDYCKLQLLEFQGRVDINDLGV